MIYQVKAMKTMGLMSGRLEGQIEFSDDSNFLGTINDLRNIHQKRHGVIGKLLKNPNPAILMVLYNSKFKDFYLLEKTNNSEEVEGRYKGLCYALTREIPATSGSLEKLGERFAGKSSTSTCRLDIT